MAHPEFAVHVLTPDGDVYEGEVQQLNTRTGVGEVGILANHVPMLARLVPAELRLHVSESETIRYAQGEGWLEVFANEARVLISEAVQPDDLDVSALREKLADAERRRDEAEDGLGGSRAGRARGRARRGIHQDRRRLSSAARDRLSPVPARLPNLSPVDERLLAERLIAYDSSNEDGVKLCAGFVKGWLEAREIATTPARGPWPAGASSPTSGPRTPRSPCCSTVTSTSSRRARSSSSPRSRATACSGAAPTT